MMRIYRALSSFAGLLSMAVVSVGLSSAPARADMADKAAGTWKTDTGSVIRLSKSGGRLVGTIVSVRDKSRRDSKNPNPKLQGRKLPGVRILSLSKSGADQWKGQLYNTEDGKTYSGFLKVVGPSKLKLQGCVLGILCKTKYWSRK